MDVKRNRGSNSSGNIFSTLLGQGGFDFLDNFCCMSSYQSAQLDGEAYKINSVIDRCSAGIASCDDNNSMNEDIGDEDDSIFWLSDNTMMNDYVDEDTTYNEDECSSDGGSWGNCGDQSLLRTKQRRALCHEDSTIAASTKTRITSNRTQKKKYVNSGSIDDDDNQTTITAATTGSFSGSSSSSDISNFSSSDSIASNNSKMRNPLPILDTPSVLKERQQQQQKNTNNLPTENTKKNASKHLQINTDHT